MNQHLRRFLEPTTRVEFQLPMEICATRIQVRSWQSFNGQTRSVCATANRFEERLHSRAARRFHCIFRQLRIVLEHFLHVLVILFDVDRNLHLRVLRRSLGHHVAQQLLLRLKSADVKIAQKDLQA